MQLKTFGGLTLMAGTGQPVPVQRRRLALLSVIALSGRSGLSRERLLGLFWPDSDEERGRGALAQALYALRRDLGRDDLFAGTAEVALAPGILTVDALQFDEDVRSGKAAQAVGRYSGPFLDGFYLSEAPEFERWAEERRGEFDRAFRDALERAASQARDAGRTEDAQRLWGRLAALDPTNGRVVMASMRSAAAAGDRAGAVTQARVYARLMEAEGIKPDPAVAALAEELRRHVGNTAEWQTASAGPASAPAAAPTPYMGPVPRSARRPTGAIAAAVALMGIAIVAFALLRPDPGETSPVFAVGRISDQAGDSASGALGEMLTTGLARVPGLSVVSSARMHELAGGETVQMLPAARRAGATVLLEGTLFRRAASGYRLELRRTAVDDGRVLGAQRIEATDLFSLVDSATGWAAAARGVTAPAAPLAAQTTSSLAAYRLYSQGLQSHFAGNDAGARALLDAAVVEDSTFAMAWLWSARLNPQGFEAWNRRMLRAMALAPRAPERERLLIQLEWANTQDAPARLAIADTLARLYPDDPEAHLQHGFVLQWDGQFLAAAEAYSRALARDRGGLANMRPGYRCLACEAVASIGGAYRMADSGDAAVRSIRRWTRESPASADAWYTLADALMFTGGADQAYAAERVAAPLDRPERSALVRALIAIHAADDWDGGAAFFEAQAARPEVALQGQAVWWLMIIRRNQGRLTEALNLARRSIRLGGIRSPEAQVLFESGDYASAARAFRAIADDPPRDVAPSRVARETAWYLTHTATALAAMGDTAPLLTLADSIEVLGRQTAYGRDRRLHHHVRGLLYASRGRRAEAIESFARAIFSPTAGYSRTNYEMARALIAERRHQEAVRVLRPVLHGPMEASNLYLTRSDVHALLGEAFDAAGQRDSATAHYRKAISAWGQADLPVAERRRRLEQRLAGLESSPRQAH